MNRQKVLDAMIKKNSNADLVFMVDCTGSMDSYIQNTKLQIANIVNVCVEAFENQVDMLFDLISKKNMNMIA